MLVDVEATSQSPDTMSNLDDLSIAVVITTYNHAHFLDDAISSVMSQSRPADEVLVVDDGSADDPAAVVARFPSVRLIRQENRGLAGARNTGWKNCQSSHIVFLDADDLLLPHALETGARFARSHPESAFVYGGHRYVSESLEPIGEDIFFDVGPDPHRDLLLRNAIGMHAAVLYKRECLDELGGFDETLRRCEDHDLYLRASLHYPIYGYPVTVAQYRRHCNSMTADREVMLKSVLAVLDRHEARLPQGVAERSVLEKGRASWRSLYAKEMLLAARAEWASARRFMPVARGVARAVSWAPVGVARAVSRELFRRAQEGAGAILLGKGRSKSRGGWGFDRGLPVDRYYIESFISKHAHDIRGRVLEVGDNHYTLRFGGPAVERSDVLHVNDSNPRATIVGDLADQNCLPKAQFDCIVLTQTLHLVFDMRAAVATLYAALKPGGVLLLTSPGISPVGRQSDWGNTWCWSLTAVSARRLLEERFGPSCVDVAAHGNLDAAVAFLNQRAVQEIGETALDEHDPCYPVIVAARAMKKRPS